MCRDASAPLVARRVRKIRESAVSVETVRFVCFRMEQGDKIVEFEKKRSVA